jgi:NAD(P)-dependent dehydrogenase (short-subunit alcohol dehydrogenase family)
VTNHPTFGGAEDLDVLSRTRLAGKVVIVTGAGQGIGRATARRLAAEGACTAVVDRNAEGAERTATEIEGAGGDAIAVVADLSLPEAAENMAAEVAAKCDRIDVLVNNIGGATQLKPFLEWTPDEMVAEVNRSLLPALWCCRAVLPYMLSQNYGRIVNIGAESVRNGLWDRLPYNVAKGGIHALTTSLARELAESGITCNCVAPAATDSKQDALVSRMGRDLTEAERKHRAELRARMLSTIPLGRSADPREQAAAIAFLASDDSSFITGQVLSVNGGSSML